MTKILIDEAVVRQALEALEYFEDAIRYDNEQDDIGARVCCGVLSYNPHEKDCKAVKAITALRQALEQPAQQEPVAWLFQHEETGLTECVDTQQVEWGFEKNNPRWQKVAPLYTTPPAPAQKPDRQELQAAGIHPAPCARHCEANAFQIAARGMRKQITELQEALESVRGNKT
jgi:hypothetical protein